MTVSCWQPNWRAFTAMVWFGFGLHACGTDDVAPSEPASSVSSSELDTLSSASDGVTSGTPSNEPATSQPSTLDASPEATSRDAEATSPTNESATPTSTTPPGSETSGVAPSDGVDSSGTDGSDTLANPTTKPTSSGPDTQSSTADETWRHVEGPEIPLFDPDDCELTPLDAPKSEQQCIYQAKCGSRQAGVNCTDIGFGTWLCDCMEFSTITGFELTNVDIDTACRAAAPLCTWGVHPSQVEPPECEAAVQNTTNYPCERSMRCTQQVHVGEVAVATTYHDIYARCIDDQAGGLQCNCLSESMGYLYSVEGTDDAAAACEAGTQLCDPFERVELGAPSCEVRAEELHSDDCSWEHDCTYSVALPASEVKVYESPWATCRVHEEQVNPSCECQVMDRRLAFTFADPGLDLQTCVDAVELCASRAEPVATDAIECVEETRYDAADFCTYRANCTQHGVIGDAPIITYGGLVTSCSELTLEPGTWRCSCDLGHAVAMTEFSAASSSPDMCVDFAQNCITGDLFEQIDE